MKRIGHIVLAMLALASCSSDDSSDGVPTCNGPHCDGYAITFTQMGVSWERSSRDKQRIVCDRFENDTWASLQGDILDSAFAGVAYEPNETAMLDFLDRECS